MSKFSFISKGSYKILFLFISAILLSGIAIFLFKDRLHFGSGSKPTLALEPKIVVTPDRVILDQPLEISISNLAPNIKVTLETKAKDKDGNAWIARADFMSDENGQINVAKQAPISGSYAGVDPMGLFWSLAPESKDPYKNTAELKFSVNLCQILLSVYFEKKLVAKKIINRLWPSVERKEIRENGIFGTLFYKNGISKGPGVIALGGSDGFLPETISQFIANHGYTVLALGYFGMKGLPEKLSLIPLEYFQSAVRWLKKYLKEQLQAENNKVAIMGVSRGAEAVLLVASTFTGEFEGAVAVAGPSLVYSDFSQENNSAWTYKGQQLPFMRYMNDNEIFQAVKQGHIINHAGTIDDPLQNDSIFLYGMKKLEKIAKKTEIKVEKITCPILIISGQDDKMWPSSFYGKNIMKRLDRHGSKIKRKHADYQNAGHYLFTYPYAPSIDLPGKMDYGWTLIGGTQAGNAHAQKEAWSHMLNFLDFILKK